MQSSQDVRRIANPFFEHMQIFGQTFPGPRILFHDEIEVALAERAKEKAKQK